MSGHQESSACGADAAEMSTGTGCGERQARLNRFHSLHAGLRARKRLLLADKGAIAL
jgi:hypothetical protein